MPPAAVATWIAKPCTASSSSARTAAAPASAGLAKRTRLDTVSATDGDAGKVALLGQGTRAGAAAALSPSLSPSPSSSLAASAASSSDLTAALMSAWLALKIMRV